jgi:hypothetical protein
VHRRTELQVVGGHERADAVSAPSIARDSATRHAVQYGIGGSTAQDGMMTVVVLAHA